MTSRLTQYDYVTTHSLHASHDAELLSLDETLQNDADRRVDVILVDVSTQMHSSVRFGETNYRLDVTHGDGDAAGSHRFASEVGIELGDLKCMATT